MGQENSTPSQPAALARDWNTSSVFSVRPISQRSRRRASRRRTGPPDQVCHQSVPAEDCASSSMTDKEEFSFVTCRLCQGLLNVPKLLDCWHPFCLPCLTDYRNSQPDKGLNVISCPICKQTTPLPSDGVGGLRHKANTFLLRVADLSSFIETYHNSIFMKHYCSQQARFTPANRTCKQCKDYLCQDCSIYHLLQHTSTTRTCRRHNLPTSMFCESCNIIVCTICAQTAHAQHVTSKVDVASENYRDILGQLVEKCKDLKWPLEESLEKNIQETRFQIQNSTEALISQVTQYIRKKEQFLLSQLEQFSAEMKGRVETEKEKYTPLADSCKPMCELGDRLVRFGSNHELLSVQQEMTRQLTEASIEQTPKDIGVSLQERIKFIPDQLPDLDNLLPLNVIGTTGTYTEAGPDVREPETVDLTSAADSVPAVQMEEAGPSTEADDKEAESGGDVTLTAPVAEDVSIKEEVIECDDDDPQEGNKRKRHTSAETSSTKEEEAAAKKQKVVEIDDDLQAIREAGNGIIYQAGTSSEVVVLDSPEPQEAVSTSVDGFSASQEVPESAEDVSQASEDTSDNWIDASDGSQEDAGPADVKEEVEEQATEEVEMAEEKGDGDGDNIATRVRGRKKGWLNWW